MSAGTYDFTVEQGTTLDQKFIWKDSNNVAIPLTGYTGRMQIRPTLADATVLQSFTTANGGIVLGPADGEIHIIASDTTTAGWTNWPTPSGQSNPQGVYDLELVSPGGIVKRLLKGKVTLDLEVTR